MVCGSDRPHACEPLEGRYLMDSTFGQAVSGFVQSPTGDVFQRGPLIALESQLIYHNPDHAPPPVIFQHAHDVIFP
jgi:hypothetical protein